MCKGAEHMRCNPHLAVSFPSKHIEDFKLVVTSDIDNGV